MIAGESSRAEDIDVNVCKKKQLTNTRSSGADDALKLVPAVQMSLEQCIEFIASDEYVEITPENIRMRKSILDSTERRELQEKNNYFL
jgi:GTP-binding protein